MNSKFKYPNSVLLITSIDDTLSVNFSDDGLSNPEILDKIKVNGDNT